MKIICFIEFIVILDIASDIGDEDVYEANTTVRDISTRAIQNVTYPMIWR